MDCSKLNQNINSDCPEAMRQFMRVGWIADRESLFNIVKNNFTVSFETDSGFYPIYDRSRKPFNGTKCEIVEADYYNKTNETVQFPILLNSPENSEIVNILKNGKAVVILEQVSKGENGVSKYPIFGLDGGLYPQELPSDSASDVAWIIKLQEENTTQCGYFLYDTSESATKILLDRLNNYIIEGMSIAVNCAVNLEVDSDKYGYVFYSDKSKSATIDGILAVAATIGGDVMVSIPKDSSVFSIDESAFTGVLNNAVSTNISAVNSSISTINSNAVEINCSNSISITNVGAFDKFNLTTLNASGCSLTHQCIETIFAQALYYEFIVDYNFLSGSNASYNDLSAQGKSDYAALIALGGTINIREDAP